MKLLSVVIPALNSAETIYFTLASVLSNSFPRDEYEVIVVDNGSLDDTKSICEKFPVEVISCPKGGQGAALNRGVEKAAGHIICFTDSDVIVSKNWLERISEYFKNHPDVDGIGGSVLSPLHGHKSDIQKFTGEIFVEDQGFPAKVTRAQYMKTYEGGQLGSANCAYKKEILVSIGGFDDSLLFTDVDLCWRLVKARRKLVFDPQIEVIHLFPWSLQGVLKQQFKWGKSCSQLMKVYSSNQRSSDYLRNDFLRLYLIMRSFLLLLSPRRHPKTKQLLRCLHYVSYHMGCLYGEMRDARAKNQW